MSLPCLIFNFTPHLSECAAPQAVPNFDFFFPSAVVPARSPHSKLRITLAAPISKHNMPWSIISPMEASPGGIFLGCDHARADLGIPPLSPGPPRLPNISLSALLEMPGPLSPPRHVPLVPHTAGSFGSLTHFQLSLLFFLFFSFQRIRYSPYPTRIMFLHGVPASLFRLPPGLHP